MHRCILFCHARGGTRKRHRKRCHARLADVGLLVLHDHGATILHPRLQRRHFCRQRRLRLDGARSNDNDLESRERSISDRCRRQFFHRRAKLRECRHDIVGKTGDVADDAGRDRTSFDRLDRNGGSAIQMLRADVIVLDTIVARRKCDRLASDVRIDTGADDVTATRERTTERERDRRLFVRQQCDRFRRRVAAQSTRPAQSHRDWAVDCAVRRDAHGERPLEWHIGACVRRGTTVNRDRYARHEQHRNVKQPTHLVDVAIDNRRAELHRHTIDQRRHRRIGTRTARFLING